VNNVLLLVSRLGDGQRVQTLELEAVAGALLGGVHVVSESEDELQNLLHLFAHPQRLGRDGDGVDLVSTLKTFFYSTLMLWDKQWVETNQSNFHIYPTDIRISRLMVLC
jgi:hypothetical protein